MFEKPKKTKNVESSSSVFQSINGSGFIDIVWRVLCVQDTYRRRQVQRSVTRQMSFDLTKLMVTEDWFSDISPQTMRRLLNIVSVTGHQSINTDKYRCADQYVSDPAESDGRRYSGESTSHSVEMFLCLGVSVQTLALISLHVV